MHKNSASRVTAALAGILLAPVVTHAADNPGAHQHGHAVLQIAIDGNTAEVILRSPAYNLLGLEHSPRTGQQRQQLAGLEQWATSTPLVNTVEGNCITEEASVQSAWPETSRQQGHTANGHSDLEIFQSLSCNGLADQNTLTTPLTDRFPALEHLEVQWISSGVVGLTTLEPGEVRIRIAD
ncbi:ZrgA family zinc uptake protein [Marinobacter sp. VGCF2001]|uniref:ZrgA family zinc uptake protein n=1 Tax=Marinobacter sp. VGCF2001 TaxID=3417189 RepID=UPI003CE92B47